MAERWIYFFGKGLTEGDPDRKDILGGKGASLAAMCRAGLPVPAGFTITTECCRQFLDIGGRWPEGLEPQVRDNLARLEQATGRTFGSPEEPLLVSVRSGAAVSMPGMMDTILNCGLTPEMASSVPDPAGFWRVYAQFVHVFAKTVADVGADAFAALENKIVGEHGEQDAGASADAYRKLAEAYQGLYAERAGKAFPQTPWETLVACIDAVFNSWNNDRAVTYRREHDVRGCDGTAVNVQSMFASQVSGIVFTTNPNDLAAEEMIIESAYGLGEAVVSGDVHPDHFLVDRKDLSIRKRTLGHKQQVVSAMGDVARRDADAASLTDEQIVELARMAVKVEEFFGRPMDIEFGWADGEFSLLQARAIRGLEVAEDVEIGRLEEIHRLRELANGKRKVWVLHNLNETLPAPTPLTWDIIRHFMSGDGGFGQMYKDFGYRPSARVCREGFLELICGRIYADPVRAADLFWDGMPLTYDVDQVARDPKALDTAPTRFDPNKATGRFFLSLPRLVRNMLRCSRLMKQLRRRTVERFENQILPPYLAWVRAKRDEDLAGMSTPDLLHEVHARIDRVLTRFGGESLKCGFFGGLAQARMEQMLTRLMGDQAGTELALTLTQGLDGDSTIEQNACLYRVARQQVSLAEFIDRYGHRAVGEMELSRPRWREDRTYVKQIVDVYLDESVPSPESLHQANAARRQAAERALPATLRQWGGSCFLEDITADLADAQAMLPYRETGKHYLMMGYEVVRLALTELARRWDLGRDVFFLRLAELRGYAEHAGALAEKIAARKVRWQSARRLEMPDVVDTADLDDLGLPRHYESAAELPGQAIASGVATGPARIVFDPRQTSGVCTDYILVCPSTDPAWTALFVHAAGLVVEQGGVLSHGAIVARDFGIPAVVCPDATRRIPEGASVRVDGSRGLITLVDE